MSDDARLSCSQPLIGSLTGFSYLSSSWDVTGVAPGHAWIDASEAVSNVSFHNGSSFSTSPFKILFHICDGVAIGVVDNLKGNFSGAEVVY